MILHSIIPTQLMQQMIAEQLTPTAPTADLSSAIPLSTTALLEGRMQDGQFTVGRIISTDPKDFLNPDISPGVRLCPPSDMQVF